jgi:hypothetical protein
MDVVSGKIGEGSRVMVGFKNEQVVIEQQKKK